MSEDLLTRLLARATWHAEETVVRPIAFALLLAQDGKESLIRILGAGDSAEVLKSGYESVTNGKDTTVAYAVACDEALRLDDGSRVDALVFYCGVRGAAEASVFARPYSDDGERVHWTHEAVLLQHVENLLA